MAERPNIKDMLAAARRAGAAKAAGESSGQAEAEAEAPAEETVEAEAAAPAPAPAAPKEPLGRPLTMKEKLAAARSGAAPAPAAPAAPAAKAAPVEAAAASEEAAAPAAPRPAPVPTGRPLTMKEKLAAARGGAAPAAAGPAPAAAKPAAAKAAAAPAAKPAAARELPPLDKITDPRDLAEALRRAGADKEKAAKAEAAARAASAAGATPGAAAAAAKASAAKKLESKVVPPKPSKDAVAETGTSPVTAPVGRRSFLGLGGITLGLGAIIWAGWGAFAAALGAQTIACVRFMFPNVLAEPPSTIKVGLASNFEKEQVNDRWKAEWGFWIVRSSAYDGEDKIYAIQSVCTHLGCPPNWLAAEAKFKCPCHGSGFYISGVNFEGPAPRPLERFKVAQNDAGEIVVDKSQKYQEELKQWSDPDSFIIA